MDVPEVTEKSMHFEIWRDANLRGTQNVVQLKLCWKVRSVQLKLDGDTTKVGCCMLDAIETRGIIQL